jgi:hypothetical protein
MNIIYIDNTLVEFLRSNNGILTISDEYVMAG